MGLLEHVMESGLQGPYSLMDMVIDENVPASSPGVYALGHAGGAIGKVFYIYYVGRSDTDVNRRLKNHVGKYLQFKYRCYGSAKAAFEKECCLCHDLGPSNLDNEMHPARPRATDWTCPRCRIYD